MNTAQEFRQRVEDYLVASGMKATAFGMQAMNSPSFVGRLRRGGDVKLETVDKVLMWISDHPPELQPTEGKPVPILGKVT